MQCVNVVWPLADVVCVLRCTSGKKEERRNKKRVDNKGGGKKSSGESLSHRKGKRKREKGKGGALS
jgi:hypothetical protein